MLATSNALARTATILITGLVILYASSSGARPRTDVPQSGGSCLVLEWMDPHNLLPAGEQWMAKETLRILDGADIGARWEWKREQQRPDDEHRLRVVLVPSEPSGPGWRLSPDTLGATVIDEHGDDAPPAVYIFYNAVATTLGVRKRDDHRSLSRTTRALGRVVAHEIAHAIVPLEPHAPAGLMRASLEPRFLTARRDVAIDAHWKHALGRGMSKLCAEL